MSSKQSLVQANKLMKEELKRTKAELFRTKKLTAGKSERREIEQMLTTQKQQIESLKQQNKKLKAVHRLHAMGAHVKKAKHSRPSTSKRTKPRSRRGSVGKPAAPRRPMSASVPRSSTRRSDESKTHIAAALHKIETRLRNTEQRGAAAAAVRGDPDRVPLAVRDNTQAVSSGVGGGPYPMLGPDADITAVMKELRQRRADIALLNSRYRELANTLRAETEIRKQALNQYKHSEQQLEAALAEVTQLRSEKQQLEISADQVPHLRQLVDQLRKQSQQQHQRTSEYWQSVFDGGHIQQKMKEIIHTKDSRIQQLQSQVSELANALDDTKDDLKRAVQRKDELADKVLSMTKEMKEKDEEVLRANRRAEKFSDRLNILESDSHVSLEDLEKALELVMREKTAPSRFQTEPLLKQRVPSDAADLKAYCYQLRDLVQTKDRELKQALADLQSKENALRSQHEVSRRDQLQLQATKRQLQRAQSDNEKLRNQMAKGSLARAPGPSDNSDAMSDISMFSGVSTELGDLTGNQNALSFRVVEAKLDENFPGFQHSSAPLTFVAVDFYDFETMFSPQFGGFRPRYNYTAQYDVDVDSTFIDYLQHDVALVEVYALGASPSDNVLIGYCKIPLDGLLRSGTPRLEGTVQLLNDRISGSGGDSAMGGRGGARSSSQAAVAGTLHYVLRMYRPVVLTSIKEQPSARDPPSAGHSQSNRPPLLDTPSPAHGPSKLTPRGSRGGHVSFSPNLQSRDRGDSLGDDVLTGADALLSPKPTSRSRHTPSSGRHSSDADESEHDFRVVTVMGGSPEAPLPSSSKMEPLSNPTPPLSAAGDTTRITALLQVETVSFAKPASGASMSASHQAIVNQRATVDRENVVLYGHAPNYGVNGLLKLLWASSGPGFVLDASVPAAQAEPIRLLLCTRDDGSGAVDVHDSVTTENFGTLPVLGSVLLDTSSLLAAQQGESSITLRVYASQSSSSSSGQDVVGELSVRVTWRGGHAINSQWLRQLDLVARSDTASLASGGSDPPPSRPVMAVRTTSATDSVDALPKLL